MCPMLMPAPLVTPRGSLLHCPQPSLLVTRTSVQVLRVHVKAPTADATDSTGGSGSTGPTTTQSLNAAAGQSKNEAVRAAAEIEAADRGIKAAQEASSELDKLDLSKFGGSGRFKR